MGCELVLQHQVTGVVTYELVINVTCIWLLILRTWILAVRLLMGGVTRPCARARQAKRVLTQGRTGAYRGVQGRTGASRDKSLKMT